MIIEWIQTLGPILISWPVVGLIAILLFRGPLTALANRASQEGTRFKVGSVELELGMVKQAVDQVEKQQALQGDEIRAIQIALKGILTKHELGPLTMLNGPAPALIRYEPDLYGYLHRIDGLNFIQPHPGRGLYNIVEDHQDDLRLRFEDRPPFDLKQYLYITPDGQRYLSVLNEILRKAEEQLRLP